MDSLKNDPFRGYLKTLGFDVLSLVCLLVIFVVCLNIFLVFFSDLNQMLPSAVSVVSEVINDPGSAEYRSEELDMIKGGLDRFVWGSLTLFFAWLFLSLLCYSFFQSRIFDVLEGKRLGFRFWSFFTLNMLIFFVSVFLVGTALFVFVSPVNVVFFIVVLSVILLFVNNCYFVFRKKRSVFVALTETLALFRPLHFGVFAALFVCFFVVWGLLLAVFSFSPFLMSLMIVVFPLIFWPLGRVVIFRLNEVSWEHVR